MRNELLKSNLAEFRGRFGSLHDAVIHHVHCDLFSRKKGDKNFQLLLGAQDMKAPANDKWVNLTIDVEDVQQVILKQQRLYTLSIVFSMRIDFVADEVYLGNIDSSDGEITPEHYREHPTSSTQLIVVGKRCYWSISPYQERVS